jgi:hypothetical protein
MLVSYLRVNLVDQRFGWQHHHNATFITALQNLADYVRGNEGLSR